VFGWLRNQRNMAQQNANDPHKMAQKSVSTPELIFTMSRAAAQFQKWDTDVAIEEGLKASAIFYACVQKRAQAVAQVPWVAKRRTADGWEDAPDSDLQRLIDRPNPDINWSEMMELVTQHIDLAGNAYWTMIRAGNGNLPRELWPILPQGIKIVPGKERLVQRYEYQRGQVVRNIDPEDVVHIKTCNPGDFLFGMPTIQAAGRAVDVDRDSGDWQKISLQNRGVSDYAIVLDPDTTQEQIDRIRDLHRQHQGGKHNARQPYLTTKDIKTLNQSAVEMDFVASRNKVWEEIASAMGVPLPMIGVLENATLANIEVSRRIFWLDTIIPLLRMIRSQLQAQLAFDFGPDWKIDYDLSSVEALREDTAAKIKAARELWNMGVPFNRVNEVLELEVGEVEGGDLGYLSAGLLPVMGAEVDEVTGDGLPVQDVQAAALNGAQIGSAREIAQAVSNGQLPPDTAIELLLVSFPNIDRDTARRIVGPAASFEPRVEQSMDLDATLKSDLETLSELAYGAKIIRD